MPKPPSPNSPLRARSDRCYDEGVPIFTDAQRQKLDEMRREHSLESARMSSDERIRRSDELRRAAPAEVRSSSDESLEIMIQWKRRLAEPR